MERFFLSDFNEWTGEGVLSVLGATASGKTSGALDFVRKRWPHNFKFPLLVSLDSIALYRGLDIGSAKPVEEERNDFDWCGLDYLDPRQAANVRDFLNFVSPPITQALLAKRPVILVGGSHFYERALVEGMSPGERSDPEYIASLSTLSGEEILKQLSSRDARFAERFHSNDRYRLERHADLVLRQGLSYEDLFLNAKNHSVSSNLWKSTATLILGLDWERSVYEERVTERIHAMLRQGWLNEIQNLLKAGCDRDCPGLQCVGYRECVEGILSGKSEAAIFSSVHISHMQLVKKQRTWLRGLLNI